MAPIIGKIIRQQIEDSRFTFVQIAKLLDIDVSTMQRIFKAKSVQTKYLQKLSIILNVPLKVFFGESWDQPPAPNVLGKLELDTHDGQPAERFFYGFVLPHQQPDLLEKMKKIKINDIRAMSLPAEPNPSDN